MIYLDNSATTKVEPLVAEVISKSLYEDFANPASLYKEGVLMAGKINSARCTIAQVLGVKPEEIYFTASASEGNNIAIQGLALARKTWGTQLVATGYEHPSVRKPLELLCENGFEVTYIAPSTNGKIDEEKLLEEVNSKTALVCLIHVNNETGAVVDIEKLVGKIKEKNSRTAIHIDITQSFMKLKLNLTKIQADSVAFSGHKVYTPKGIGAMYLRKGINIKQIFSGGGQEKGMRAGTENIHYILGFQTACEMMSPNITGIYKHYTELKSRLLTGLNSFENIVMNSPENAVPYITSFSFLGYKSETIIHFLEAEGIYVSPASACSKGKGSHTLYAMGLSKQRIESAIRISFSHKTTGEEIDKLIEILHLAKEKVQRV